MSCGSTSSSDSDSESESDNEISTTSTEERRKSGEARRRNKNRSLKKRMRRCIKKLLKRLLNPNRDERAGGTYRICKGYSCHNCGTNENNHIPASNCLVGTVLATLSKELQLVITMFTEHHRDYPSTGNSADAIAFRDFERNLIKDGGFFRSLEFEMITFFLCGFGLTYTFGWHDLLKKAFRDNFITKDEAIYLIKKLKSFIDLIEDFIEKGVDLLNVDPRIFKDSKIEIFSMDIKFTSLDILRNVHKFLLVWMLANSCHTLFQKVLKKYIKDIGIVLLELISYLLKK